MPVAKQRPRRTVGSVLNKLIERVNSNIRRLRVLEQESSLHKTRLTSLEQELTAQKSRVGSSEKKGKEKTAAIEERIARNEATLKEIIAQLKKVTTTTTIKKLEQLIDIYNPVKSQFMTREEAEQMIDERLKVRR